MYSDPAVETYERPLLCFGGFNCSLSPLRYNELIIDGESYNCLEQYLKISEAKFYHDEDALRDLQDESLRPTKVKFLALQS